MQCSAPSACSILQHGWRGALLIRDRQGTDHKSTCLGGPGSAAHHCARLRHRHSASKTRVTALAVLRCARDTQSLARGRRRRQGFLSTKRVPLPWLLASSALISCTALSEGLLATLP